MSENVNATTDEGTELTNNGIHLSEADLVDLREYRDADHGEIAYEDAETLVFRDDGGQELNEWADAFGVERGDLSEQMHRLARQHHDRDPSGGDAWSVSDPLVFDKRAEADE